MHQARLCSCVLRPLPPHPHRSAIVAMGAVVPLARMVAYAPRMPAPALVPAPPPVLGKKKGGAAKGGEKKKK